jgi:hypothetical protein
MKQVFKRQRTSDEDILFGPNKKRDDFKKSPPKSSSGFGFGQLENHQKKENCSFGNLENHQTKEAELKKSSIAFAQ